MADVDPNGPGQTYRTRAAAMAMATFAAGYALVTSWYFYNDFFKFLGRGMPTQLDGSGFSVLVNCRLWTVLSPWRIPLAILAVAMLGLSAYRLWQKRPGARALALFTLWGVLLPQVAWFTEFSIDWYAKSGMFTAMLAALALVAVPSLLLFEGPQTLGDWRPLHGGRARLLGTGIAAAWIAFAATEFIDHSYQLDSQLAYGSALFAIAFGALAGIGILRLKVWGILAAVVAAGFLAGIPISYAANQDLYLASGGYADQLVQSMSGCGMRTAMYALLPTALVVSLSRPYLSAFVAKIRS